VAAAEPPHRICLLGTRRLRVADLTAPHSSGSPLYQVRGLFAVECAPPLVRRQDIRCIGLSSCGGDHDSDEGQALRKVRR
jgi:hypothetical protein